MTYVIVALLVAPSFEVKGGLHPFLCGIQWVMETQELYKGGQDDKMGCITHWREFLFCNFSRLNTWHTRKPNMNLSHRTLLWLLAFIVVHVQAKSISERVQNAVDELSKLFLHPFR